MVLFRLHLFREAKASKKTVFHVRNFRAASSCGSFIYLGFYVTFNTVQVISRRVVGRAEETSTYSSLAFCTVNCRQTAINYQFSHLRPCREPNPVGGESVTTLPPCPPPPSCGSKGGWVSLCKTRNRFHLGMGLELLGLSL